MKYVGSKSLLLTDTLSRLFQPGTTKEIPALDISTAQVLKVELTRLESLQEEAKAYFIITGWPDSMQEMIYIPIGASEISGPSWADLSRKVAELSFQQV